MMTKNVYYTRRPDEFIVTTNGTNAVIEFPQNVVEVETDEQTYYLAEKVYSVATKATPNLEERVRQNFEAWFEKAKQPEMERAELYDVIEALNALTEIVIGGDL